MGESESLGVLMSPGGRGPGNHPVHFRDSKESGWKSYFRTEAALQKGEMLSENGHSEVGVWAVRLLIERPGFRSWLSPF